MKEIRVCDRCYDKNHTNEKISEPIDKKLSTSVNVEASNTNNKDEQLRRLKDQEEEELQLALALSLDAIENERHIRKETSKDLLKGSNNFVTKYTNPSPSNNQQEKLKTTETISLVNNTISPMIESYPSIAPSNEITTKLDTYSKQITTNKNVIPSNELPSFSNSNQNLNINKNTINDQTFQNIKHDSEMINSQQSTHSSTVNKSPLDVFVANFNETCQLFMDRIKLSSQSGKQVSDDPTVLAAFHALMAMQPKLISYKDQLAKDHEYFNSMLIKTDLVAEARRSLNAVIEQHQQKLKEQQAEQEIFLKIQMEQKMELMRQQKQEALAYQKMLEEKRLNDIMTQESTKIKYQNKDMSISSPTSSQTSHFNALSNQPTMNNQSMNYPIYYKDNVQSNSYEYTNPENISMNNIKNSHSMHNYQNQHNHLLNNDILQNQPIVNSNYQYNSNQNNMHQYGDSVNDSRNNYIQSQNQYSQQFAIGINQLPQQQQMPLNNHHLPPLIHYGHLSTTSNQYTQLPNPPNHVVNYDSPKSNSYSEDLHLIKFD